MADHMMTAAQLAARSFCQPTGGSAAQRWICENELRADGFANTEATYEEHVSCLTNWCPTENGTLTSMLGTLPLADPLAKLLVDPTWAGQGSRHSLFSQEWG
eukprot:1673811-Pyramimonas_sp.AAC.1